MRAAYWTQFGAMLIPVGVAVLLGKPNMDTLAFWLMVAGFVSFIAGWMYTIKYENEAAGTAKTQATKANNEALEAKLRYSEQTQILRAIAKAYGVKMWKIDMLMRKWMEKEGLLDEWGQLRRGEDDE